MRYPIGMQSFPEIRNGGYVYVDKTALIHRLVTENKYYFLSRPRRFGKSLLLSTLEALFLGRRDLFRGLDIDSLDWDWEPHPVFHLDLNVRNYADMTSLSTILDRHLEEWERRYGCHASSHIPEDRFIHVIRGAYELTGRPVVILVDEYDKPLFSTMHDPALLEHNRAILQAFYGVVKSLDGYIRFAMLSGVTKFSKVSVFSGLNNLIDISMETAYNAICGITSDEIRRYLGPSLDDFARANATGPDDAIRMLADNYDGYHFSKRGDDIYNPFSLLNALRVNELGNFWFETGTPTFLVRLLQRQHFILPDLEHTTRDGEILRSSDIYRNDPVPILYQTGYLTIKGYDHLTGEYLLDYPNREVKKSFLTFLISFYSPAAASSDLNAMIRAVNAGHADRFMTILQGFFRDFPYDQIPALEVHYQNVVYIIMKLMGYHVATEYRTSDGRIDMLIKTHAYIYIIEFKMDRPASGAMRQIERKAYADPFVADGRKIIRIGATFDSRSRSLADWTISDPSK